MREFNENEIRNTADWDEHSVASRAKKVIAGPASFKAADADRTRSLAPITGTVSAAAATLTLLQGKAYRVIADVDVWFILKANASIVGTAVANTDIYLPAKTPMILKTDQWMIMSYIGAGAGNIQAVEIL